MSETKLNNLKKSLLILCVFVVSIIAVSLAMERYLVLPSMRGGSITKEEVNSKTPSNESVSSPLRNNPIINPFRHLVPVPFPRSYPSRLPKLFAYYMLTEKCIPPYYLETVALGDSSICDVYVNSYKENCGDPNIPSHVTHIFKKTTWSVGRNLLYYHVKESGKRYQYHIFLDDDAIPIYTEHFMEFSKANPKGNYFQSAKGIKEGIYWLKDGKSAWRLFEEDLLRESPAYAITNYMHSLGETRLRVQSHWEKVCAPGTKMPWIVPSFYLDELFIAFHEEALPMMLPYATMFENLSWWASGILHIFRGRAILYRSGVANYKVLIMNPQHRSYPRGKLSNDFLVKYLEGEGKDLKGLIDPRELDWSNYDSWWKFESAFMHTKAICTKPLKFPANKYALKRL